MGTRADMYVGRGPEAEWLGSIAWDGYPDGIPDPISEATDEASFRAAVAEFIASRDDGTKPEQGWPWPWEDSGTTDYAYAFDGGEVYISGFGGAWFKPGEEDVDHEVKTAEFPNMRDRMNVTLGERSGITILSTP